MGRTRIDRLSDKERARFDEWADRWIEIGLRTGDADRPRFEAAVVECYRFAGLPVPRVVWTTSPLAVALAGPIAAHLLYNRAVRGAVDGAVGGAVDGAVHGAWHRVIGGQFWIGGWYWGGAWTSYFREVCNLELPGDLWDRARAYEATMESACWWWPHRDFVIVSERPTVIHRELVDESRPRGWGSHRLHCSGGPAVAFRDGFGVWAWHGVTVPQHVIEQPDLLTADTILGEGNAEVRRVMLERAGYGRVLDRAATVDSGSWSNMQGDQETATLYRLDLADDEPLMVVRVECPSTGRVYLLRVDPDAYGGLSGEGSARAAVASTWRNPDGSMVFPRPADYVLEAAS